MKRRTVVMPILAILIALLAVELILQLAALANPRVGMLLSPGIPRSIPDPALSSRPNPALPDHDEAGWRNPVALERADIVVLGDSQTYGSEVGRSNAWPLLLGEELKVPTYNMGFSGWGAVQYHLVGDHALALKPRVLVVAIYSGNDFADAFKMAYRPGSDGLGLRSDHPPDHFDAVDRVRGPLGKEWKESRRTRRGWWKTFKDAHLQSLEQNFKIWGLIRGLSRIEAAEVANVKTDSVREDFDRYAAKVAYAPLEQFYPVRSDGTGTVLTPYGRGAVLDRDDPRIAEGVAITLRVLEGLNERCSDDCRLVVLTIPTKELVYAEVVREAGGEVPEAYRRLVVAESELWRDLHGALDALEITTVDALVPLRASLEAGRNPYLSDWDGHPNVTGNQAIARHLAAQPALRYLSP